MNEKLKKAMRNILMERYGVDIDEAKCFYSTQNYAFIFPEKPYMIRVSMTPKKSKQEIMSEIMWVDDLKLFKETVCEPSVSLKGNLLEEFEIDGIVHRASMFRTARGNVQSSLNMTPMFFICVGDLLGGIHRVSTEQAEMGFHYKRRNMSEIFSEQKEKVWHLLSPEVQNRIEDIEKKVNALSQDIGRYGLCHGDFHMKNFFVEANNIWVFDFDGCTYANYLYDVAAFVQACFLYGYGAGKDCRTVLNEDILPYFKIGYTLNHKVDENYWDNLELLISYRTAFTLMMLTTIDKIGVADDTEKIKQFFAFLITQDSPLDAMTQAMKAMR